MEYSSVESVEVRIDKNYNCIKELEKSVSPQNTDEENLEIITFIGLMYTMYITGIYSSFFLEQKIIEIGKKIRFFPSNEPEDGQILIVMSQCRSLCSHKQ